MKQRPKKNICVFLAAALAMALALCLALGGCGAGEEKSDPAATGQEQGQSAAADQDKNRSAAAESDDSAAPGGEQDRDRETKNEDSGSSDIKKEEYAMKDNANTRYPDDYIKPVENGGTVVKLTYTAHRYFGEGDSYEKKAYVYLPAGYDENDTEKKYNVLYLLHGGSASEELYFVWGAENGNTETKNLLDHLMANGDMEPCIVCTPTYNMEGAKDETESSLNFYQEWVSDLIPAVEGKYHTYAETVDAEGIRASRDHRAFGGFSMGAAATWAVFANEMEAARYFLPLCGDSWIIQMGGGRMAPAKTAEALKKAVADQGFTGDDFRIFWGTGTEDLAYPNITPMLDALKQTGDPFRYCENYKDGNLYCCVLDGGGHDFPSVHTAMYQGLGKFFR